MEGIRNSENRFTNKLIGLVIFVLATNLNCSHGHLLRTLLDNYDKRELPQQNVSEPVFMKIGLALQQIVNLDQKTQILTLSVWVRQYWNDYRLSWDPSQYNDTRTVYIPPSDHWKPDIVLYDNAHDDHVSVWEVIPSMVTYEGDVMLIFPSLLHTSCPQNVQFFPMDTQVCSLKFGSWALDGGSLVLEMRENAADYNSAFIKQIGEWDVVNFEATRHVAKYGCCPNSFYDVTFTLTLKRQWKMIFLYLFLPNLFVNILTVLQFLLPCDSSERITLGITIFLAVIVYLLLLNGVLPINERVPVIIVYMSVTIVLNGISQILTILILWLHFNGSHDNHMALPAWARDYIIHKLATFLGMHRYITPDYEHETKLTSFHSTIEVIQSTSSANEVDDEDEEEEVEIPSKSSVRIQLPASSIQLSDTKSSAQSIRRQSLGAEPSALSVRRSKIVPDVKAEPSTHTVRINKAAPWSKASLSQKSEKRQSITAELKDSSSILLLKILKNLEDKTESKAEKEKDLELRCEWMQVAMVVDRLLFIIYIVLSTILCLYVYIALAVQ